MLTSDKLSMLMRDVQKKYLPGIQIHIYFIYNILVSADTLRRWLSARYTHATQYYSMRRQLCTHMSPAYWLEYICHLTRQMPTDISIQLDGGAVANTNYLFDIMSDCEYLS